MRTKKLAGFPGILRKGRVLYNNLLFGRVTGPGASWSLAIAKRQGRLMLATGHALRSKLGGGCLNFMDRPT